MALKTKDIPEAPGSLLLCGMRRGSGTYRKPQNIFFSVEGWRSSIQRTGTQLRFVPFASCLKISFLPFFFDFSKVKHHFADCSNLVCLAQWCIFHQYHLIVDGVLRTLDSFASEFVSAGADDAGGLPAKYFSMVATICNAWRDGQRKTNPRHGCQEVGRNHSREKLHEHRW